MDYKNAKGTGLIEGKGAAGGNILLCKDCQIWADTIQVKAHQPPWQHCHHELERLIEPGEKEVSDNPYKIMLELCLNNLQLEISKARRKL